MMLGELLDRTISIFAPERAAKRAHARRVYRNISERAWEAARRDRLNDSWLTSNQSADRTLTGEADRVRMR